MAETHTHLLYRTDRKSASRNNGLRFQYRSYPRILDAGSQLLEPVLFCIGNITNEGTQQLAILVETRYQLKSSQLH